jgi:carbamoyltransferase
VLILGVNAYHADSAACLVADGELVAAAEEERFRRVKHWAGFPLEAIRYCLDEAGVGLGEVDHIAVNRDLRARLLKKIAFSVRRRPSLALVADRLGNAARVRGVRDALAEAFDAEPRALIHRVETPSRSRERRASRPWRRAWSGSSR